MTLRTALAGLKSLFLLLLLVGTIHGHHSQDTGQNMFSVYDDGLFTPFEDLNALSATEFTVLGHPAFPRHNVRVKQSSLCDDTVRSYSGYIDVEARHLFFWFFESRSDPDSDDIIFWTNGGPGGSSMLGLFMENGPCRVTGPNSSEPFPYSWNDRANIFFVDQPVGVGFSYAEYGESVSTTPDAAEDIAAFMAIFFEHFAKFKGRPLHLAGESYGGRYIPVFASTIYDKNAVLVQAGLSPINLSSIMIGNGCTDHGTMYPAYYDTLCGDPLFPPILSVAQCVRMKQLVPRCVKRYQESCIERFDRIDCAAAAEFCETALSAPMSNRNMYDRARPCKGQSGMDDCYPILSNIVKFLSDEHTQELVGVDPAVRGNFSWVYMDVNRAFEEQLDAWSFPAQFHIAALLERGIRALVYVGDTDFICNWIGNERMTLALEWTKQEEFRGQPLRAWSVDGNVTAGLTRSGGGLTFATIAGAGHMAPYDKPAETLELVKRWLAGEAL